MVTWCLFFTKQAQKDAQKIAQSNLKPKVQILLDLISADPLANPPPYERLVGDLAGLFSRRINIQHRLIYQVLKDRRAIKVLRMWSHYE